MQPHPFPNASPPRTHVVRFTDARGGALTSQLAETTVGEDLESIVAYLGGGQLDRFDLDAVYSIDLTPGRLRIVDVTCAVLQRVAAWVETAGIDLPVSLSGAFDRYGVRQPIAWAETDYRDLNDEHRFGHADYGIEARA